LPGKSFILEYTYNGWKPGINEQIINMAIEGKNLTLRTRVKRLCRRTICFSKSIVMHDIVVGLVINNVSSTKRETPTC